MIQSDFKIILSVWESVGGLRMDSSNEEFKECIVGMLESGEI